MIGLLVGLIIGLFAVTGSAFAQSQKVGISIPLSGNNAPLGAQFVAGARLAQKNIPGAGEIELIISDDGCDSELAQLAAEDIRDAGAMLIAGFLCNEPVYTAATVFRDSPVPLLISGARSRRILKDRKRRGWNVWQMSPSDEDAARAAFDVLIKRWRGVPYAIVDDGTIFGRTQADEFRALMEDAGQKPQFVDNFRPAQSTQAGLVRRLTRAGVEAVYLAASAQDVALIGRNLVEFGQDIGASIEIVTAESVSLLPYIEDNKDIPVGLLALMPPPPEDIAAVRALQPVISQAGLEPEPYLLLGYATMQVVVQYLALNLVRDEKGFSSGSFSTILGDVKFDAEGKNLVNPYRLYRWNGTRFTKATGTQ